MIQKGSETMFVIWLSVFIIIFMVCGFIYLGLYVHQQWNELSKVKRFFYFLMMVGCLFNVYIYVTIIKVITGAGL